MRKKVNYFLAYREDGVDGQIEIEIDFISNRVLKEYSELMTKSATVEKSQNRLNEIYEEISNVELTDEQIEELKIEEKKLTENILSYSDNGFFERRQDLLIRILIDNGYSSHAKLMDPEFWESCVEPIELLGFLTSAIYKDLETKKKLFGR